mmetsp:Transcript_2695/g.2956  ORF Transcript_2695/g.2956 Transcript_2695/m.2956 type:complete len:95 (+) Transcript_2695:131-415(+)
MRMYLYCLYSMVWRSNQKKDFFWRTSTRRLMSQYCVIYHQQCCSILFYESNQLAVDNTNNIRRRIHGSCAAESNRIESTSTHACDSTVLLLRQL